MDDINFSYILIELLKIISIGAIGFILGLSYCKSGGLF